MAAIGAGLSLLLAPACAQAAGGPPALAPADRPLSVILLLAALSLLPFLLVVATSFAKMAVVLHILRSALGAPGVPPAMVVTGLALVLTGFVMAPTAARVHEAVMPVMERSSRGGLLDQAGLAALQEAARRAAGPVREFLRRHSSSSDRAAFLDLARGGQRAGSSAVSAAEGDMQVLVPAFAVSQLRSAFLIGFLLFIPFLVVEMVVANVLLALGLHAMAPSLVALPFKLLLFVMADGWSLLARGLVLSYG